MRRLILSALLLWPALASAQGTVTTSYPPGLFSFMYNGLGCTGGQVVRRNVGGTAFECATIGGSGDVVGPASATDNAIVRFDGTTGKLVQDSYVTLGDASAPTMTFAQGTLTADAPAIYHTATWNNAGTVFYGLVADITDTASAATSSPLDIRVGGISRMRLQKNGYLVVGDPAIGGGVVLDDGSEWISGDNGSRLDFYSAGQSSMQVSSGDSRMTVQSDMNIGWTSSATSANAGPDTYFSRSSAGVAQINGGTGGLRLAALSVLDSASNNYYTLTRSDLAADRNLALPLLTADDTFAVLGLAQTYTARRTFGAGLTLSSGQVIEGTEAAAPGTPAAGQVILYAKTGTPGEFCAKDDAGTETCMSAGGGSSDPSLYIAYGGL